MLIPGLEKLSGGKCINGSKILSIEYAKKK
jgi:hypothetical protein